MLAQEAGAVLPLASPCRRPHLLSRAQAVGLRLVGGLDRNKQGRKCGQPYTRCPSPSPSPCRAPNRCRVSSSDASASSSLPGGSEGRFRPHCLDTARAYWMLYRFQSQLFKVHRSPVRQRDHSPLLPGLWLPGRPSTFPGTPRVTGHRRPRQIPRHYQIPREGLPPGFTPILESREGLPDSVLAPHEQSKEKNHTHVSMEETTQYGRTQGKGLRKLLPCGKPQTRSRLAT